MIDRLRPDSLGKLTPAELKRRYGREYKALLRLGVPVLITQVGIMAVNFADTIMVGAYGTDELASAAFVNSLFVPVIVMLIGFASGIIPIVGALFGRGDSHGAGLTLKAGLQVNLAVSFVFTAIMGGLYFFLDRFGQPEDLLPLIRPYYLIVLGTVIPAAVFNCFQQASNAFNDTRMPMWIILSCNVLNIFGNWMLIYGHLGMPEMGLVGAGISTLVSRALATIAIAVLFLTLKRFRSYRRSMLSNERVGHIRTNVWRVSYPVMIQNGIECALWTLGAIVSGWFGKIQLASYQVVNTMAQLGFMTFIGFGVAASVRVSNAMGVRDYRQVRISATATLHLNLVLGTLACLVFALFGRSIISIFTPNPDVVAMAVTLIVPLLLYQYGDAVQLTYANALRGTGDVQPLLWTSVIAYVIVGMPVLLLLACVFDLGCVGVYYSFSAALFTASVLLILFFRRAVRRAESGVVRS